MDRKVAFGGPQGYAARVLETFQTVSRQRTWVKKGLEARSPAPSCPRDMSSTTLGGRSWSWALLEVWLGGRPLVYPARHQPL
jgi:hypothetical protein